MNKTPPPKSGEPIKPEHIAALQDAAPRGLTDADVEMIRRHTAKLRQFAEATYAGKTSAPPIVAEYDEMLANALDAVLRLVEGLPVTADGVRVVPPNDEIWINPGEAGGWMHDEYLFDVDAKPIKSNSWAYYGDHIWIHVEGAVDEGDHWFGKFWSTEADAVAGLSKV